MFALVLCVCLYCSLLLTCFFFFKQKTAYEMRISDWSSDVCSSDLVERVVVARRRHPRRERARAALVKSVEGQIDDLAHIAFAEIGRASCRERVCQYV